MPAHREVRGLCYTHKAHCPPAEENYVSAYFTLVEAIADIAYALLKYSKSLFIHSFQNFWLIYIKFSSFPFCPFLKMGIMLAIL